jgi:hypothetical protein
MNQRRPDSFPVEVQKFLTFETTHLLVDWSSSFTTHHTHHCYSVLAEQQCSHLFAGGKSEQGASGIAPARPVSFTLSTTLTTKLHTALSLGLGWAAPYRHVSTKQKLGRGQLDRCAAPTYRVHDKLRRARRRKSRSSQTRRSATTPE